MKAYQAGIITLKTAIKLYPDIDDVDGEIEQHEAEKNASLQQFGVYDEE